MISRIWSRSVGRELMSANPCLPPLADTHVQQGSGKPSNARSASIGSQFAKSDEALDKLDEARSEREKEKSQRDVGAEVPIAGS